MTVNASGLDFKELNEELRKTEGDVEITGCMGQRFIAAGMSNRKIDISGIPGNALGAYLNGATITVSGNAQDAVGDTMNEGSIIINGNIGDAAGYAMRGGEIYINDSGVVGFNISSRYIFKETVTEGANLMNFDEAMDAFAKNAEANLTADDIELADETVKFESINLEYFPIPSADSANEYLLTPCWILEAENAKYQTIARVVISATDGSFVKVIHEKEE